MFLQYPDNDELETYSPQFKTSETTAPHSPSRPASSLFPQHSPVTQPSPVQVFLLPRRCTIPHIPTTQLKDFLTQIPNLDPNHGTPIANIAYTTVFHEFFYFMTTFTQSCEPYSFQATVKHPEWVALMNVELEALELMILWKWLSYMLPKQLLVINGCIR